MKLNRTGSPISRDERNNINKNWETLEKTYGDVVTKSDQAKSMAEQANAKSTESVSTANEAHTIADATQKQLQEVIIKSGTSNAETIAARTDTLTAEQYGTLGERLDKQYKNVTAQLADIKINIKSFEHLKVVIANGYDWYPAIQATIDYVKSLGGGTVLVPIGEYLLSKPLKLHDYVRLEGASKESSILKRVGHTTSDVLAFNGSLIDAVIHVVGNVGVDNKNIQSYGNEISNIKLIGQSTTLTDMTKYGIYCQGLALANINNVKMEYVEKGLYSQAYIWTSELTNIRVNVCFSGFEVWSSTSLIMKDCYASNYRDFGYVCNNWLYSHMSNCAADNGGNRDYWTDTNILTTAYKFRNCKGTKVTSGGSENTNGTTLHLESNDSITIENMLHLNIFSDYTGTNPANIVTAYRISEGTNNKLENNRFEYRNPAYVGVGQANSSHYKNYVNGITEGLQLINNDVIGCPWKESGATSDSMKLHGRWLLGNVTGADKTIYVSPAGNNLTGDGTSEKPFQTITKAINTLSRVIDHTITIQLADGIYVENIIIDGFLGRGKIIIKGNATNNDLTRIRGTNASTLTITNNSIFVNVDHCAVYGYVNDAKAVNCVNNQGIIEVSNSKTAHWSKTLTNTISIYAERCPLVLSSNNTGVSKVGLNSVLGSKIAKNGTQPTGEISNEVKGNDGSEIL